MIDLDPNAALVLIDVQRGFDDPAWGERNNPDAESNIGELLEAWREDGRPIVHVRHRSRHEDSPLHPAKPGHELKPATAPAGDEPLVEKDVNSAFIGTDLEGYLRDRGIDALVLVGLTTNHCVSTTARMAENLGFEPVVVADATAAFDGRGADGRRFDATTIHDVAIANLRGEFAEVATTAELLAQVTG